MRSASFVTQNHLSKPKDLMLQNATLLRKSTPWSPNTSNSCVSCTPPATRNASLKILFKCPTPAIVFGNATKLSLLTKSTIPCACHAKAHLNAQKWSEPLVFLTFWLRNVLRATTACAFSTCQLPKVLRSRQFLTLWHWNVLRATTACTFSKCQLPNVVWERCVFIHFDLEMCFAPQRFALFRHLNFQKCSEAAVFCTFWLRHVLRATTACNFSSLIWPDCSAPAALASLLFDPLEPQIIGKTKCFATFLPFRAPGSSFF